MNWFHLIILLLTSVVGCDKCNDNNKLSAECSILPNEVYNITSNKALSKNSVHGKLRLNIKGDSTQIRGEIYGLTPSSKHGFHIHQLGDLTEGCGSAKGHYNPFNLTHGAPNSEIRHVGDLGNIEADNEGIAYIDISDNLVKLNGDNSVIGRSFVVHELADDLKTDPTGEAGARLACGVIGIASNGDGKSDDSDSDSDSNGDGDSDSSDDPNNVSSSDDSYKMHDVDIQRAASVLLPNENELILESNDNMITGFVDLEMDKNKIKIVGEIHGLSPNSIHGFHIHEFGNITENCMSAGGHYNPFNKKHGEPAADKKRRHVGDLGNIKADSKGIAYIDISDHLVKLNGKTSVIGRSFVVHEGEDDLKTDPTGESGDRLACGVIGIAEN